MRYANYHEITKALTLCLRIILITFLLKACANNVSPPRVLDKTIIDPPGSARTPADGLICKNAGGYQNQVIGDGHCVALIKHCANAPNTNYWRPGPQVLASSLKPGTVIATFEGSRYTNQSGQHAAIYIKHSKDGIWVWDQWLGKPVHKRLIRVRYDRADASNTAQAYRVVQLAD